MMGESPQRPGSLKANPLVVVQPEISPLSFRAEQWMVPVCGNKTLCTAASRCSGSSPRAAARAGAPRRPVHAAGVEFDHAFFVGNSAETDRIVIGIVFRTFHHLEGSIEGVSPTFQKGECAFEISVAVVGANNDGALVRSGLGVAFWRGALLGLLALSVRSDSSGDCSEKGSLNEITARESHVPPAGMKAGSISRERARLHLAWLSR